jgi:hypothetical protein
LRFPLIDTRTQKPKNTHTPAPLSPASSWSMSCRGPASVRALLFSWSNTPSSDRLCVTYHTDQDRKVTPSLCERERARVVWLLSTDCAKRGQHIIIIWMRLQGQHRHEVIAPSQPTQPHKQSISHNLTWNRLSRTRSATSYTHTYLLRPPANSRLPSAEKAREVKAAPDDRLPAARLLCVLWGGAQHSTAQHGNVSAK